MQSCLEKKINREQFELLRLINSEELKGNLVFDEKHVEIKETEPFFIYLSEYIVENCMDESGEISSELALRLYKLYDYLYYSDWEY